MLQKLIIKNIALISHAEISFSKGLNVLSGETGAGKSVIIESLNFVLGAKADKSLIKSGQSECMVVAEFDVYDNQAIKEIYSEFDFDDEEILLVSRKFNSEGKSSIKINGNSVTASMLKKFTSALVDVHGQSEHFNLLKTSNQLALIDKFGGQDIIDIKDNLNFEYQKYKDVNKRLEEFGGDEGQRLIRLNILNYQINEISSAELKEDEEENLLLIRQKLNNQERIIKALNAIKDGIGSEGGVEDIFSNITKLASSVSDFDKEYLALYQSIDNVFCMISDIQRTTGNLIDSFEILDINPYEIEERLDLIKNLKNKYGSSIEEINNLLQSLIDEKDRLENYSEQIEKLEKEKTDLEQKIYSIYNNLSDKRQSIAKIFENNVLSELKELAMTKSQFVINFQPKPTIDECKFDSVNGFDNLEFLFSANLGEPLKPLSFVISGGEMSRFMLAIKAQTAKYNDISTFIFDEIDSGISGNVAKVVAEKFAKISLSTQIIAITHLPQISAMADNNLLIEKHENDDSTLTSINLLNEDQKIYEIVRLVGGRIDSQTSIEHAKEIISWASKFKETLN